MLPDLADYCEYRPWQMVWETQGSSVRGSCARNLFVQGMLQGEVDLLPQSGGCICAVGIRFTYEIRRRQRRLTPYW